MALAGDPLELRFKMRLARHRRGTPSSIAEASAIGGKKSPAPLVRDGASAYAAVLAQIDTDIGGLIKTHPPYFTFKKPTDGTVDIRDFQTTGVVAFAKGCPISQLQAGKQDIGGHRVQVKEDYRRDCAKAIDQLAAKL